MRTNVATKIPAQYTAEGAQAARITPEQRLRRLSATCMLWEDNFYIDGKTTAELIKDLVAQVSPEFAAAVAYEARSKQNLRHLPLLVVREMARLPLHKRLVALLLPDVIQRADEISEFVSIYWKDKKQPLSAGVKKGLAAAFQKFDEYQLAKYDRNNASVRLRDVLFLSHAKPKDKVQEALWKRLVDGTMASPETWENQLSAGADKRETFETLMNGNMLGGLAWLRNLRGMAEAGVDSALINAYADRVNLGRVLPFRFIAAARQAPMFEPAIERAMFRSLQERPKFKGKTVVLVDVSGSMAGKVSGKSDISRLDAAAGVAIVVRELCDDAHVFIFSTQVRQVPARRGFALRDAIGWAAGGTHLGAAVKAMNGYGYDQLLVFTDEQSMDPVGAPVGKQAYMINVAANRNGVGYGKWNHIDGWSEAVIDYIQYAEAEGLE